MAHYKRGRAKRNPKNRCMICSLFRQQGNNEEYGPGRKPSDRRRMQAAESSRSEAL